MSLHTFLVYVVQRLCFKAAETEIIASLFEPHALEGHRLRIPLLREFVDEGDRPVVYFDRCESLDGWKSQGTLALDTADKTQGDASISTTVPKNALLFYDRLLEEPVDTQVSFEDGVLAFDLYVADLSAFGWGLGDAQIEITSGGKADVQELHWTFLADDLKLRQGWNNVRLRFASAKKTGGAINLSAVNYFRLYHTRLNSDATLKIDNIRFYEDF